MKKIRHPYQKSITEIIEKFRISEAQLANSMQKSFRDIISRELPNNVDKIFVHTAIENGSDINNVPTGRGFYIIFSDLDVKPNKCSLEYDGLSAIYRGHADQVCDRILSHLSYPMYSEMKDGKGWDQCLKLGGFEVRRAGGLDIDRPELKEVRWATLVLRLKNSTEFQRRQAEWAFDDVFGIPIGSENERSTRPILNEDYMKLLQNCGVCGGAYNLG